mmetsp:Transcript_3681/g.10692  ORF Transcript_3681/g.10692 Transcript_3681/m.10692 type:complete len:261 (+) Transcript_3681:92-874(+)
MRVDELRARKSVFILKGANVASWPPFNGKDDGYHTAPIRVDSLREAERAAEMACAARRSEPKEDLKLINIVDSYNTVCGFKKTGDEARKAADAAAANENNLDVGSFAPKANVLKDRKSRACISSRFGRFLTFCLIMWPTHPYTTGFVEPMSSLIPDLVYCPAPAPIVVAYANWLSMETQYSAGYVKLLIFAINTYDAAFGTRIEAGTKKPRAPCHNKEVMKVLEKIGKVKGRGSMPSVRLEIEEDLPFLRTAIFSSALRA